MKRCRPKHHTVFESKSVPKNFSRMMISPKLLIFSAIGLLLNVKGDLIAWNRLRNNAAKHYCKRTGILKQQDLLSQYQHFFNKNNQKT